MSCHKAAVLRKTHIKIDHCFPGWPVRCCPDQDLPLWDTAGPCGWFFTCHNQLHVTIRATISLKLVLRPTDEWQEPGIVASNDYYYSENTAWEDLLRANRMRNIHIHPHFSFSLFRGLKDLYVPAPAVVPQNLRRADLSTLIFFFPTMFNHRVCNA